MLLEMMNKIKFQDAYLVPFLFKRKSELLRRRLHQSSPALLIPLGDVSSSYYYSVSCFSSSSSRLLLLTFRIDSLSLSPPLSLSLLLLLLLLRQSSKLNYSLIFQSASTYNYDFGKHYMWLVY